MPGTTILLGAGASNCFGNLLTSQVLPNILTELKRGALFEGYYSSEREREGQRKALRSLLEELVPGIHLPQVRKHLPSITDLLSLLDYHSAQELVTSEARGPEHVMRSRQLLEHAVTWILNPWKWRRSALNRFETWFTNRQQRGPVRILTTNYDLAVEEALFGSYQDDDAIASAVDFGTEWSPVEEDRVYLRPQQPRVSYFKLHGSLSWTRCARCERLFINTDNSVSHLPTLPGTDWGNTCYCGHGPLSNVLVTPSIGRKVRNPQLASVWRAAFDALVNSDSWVIAGYSLPSEDVSVRSLLIRAWQACGTPIPRRVDKAGDAGLASRRPVNPQVEVVTANEDPQLLARFLASLPESSFFCDGFEAYLTRVQPR